MVPRCRAIFNNSSVRTVLVESCLVCPSGVDGGGPNWCFDCCRSGCLPHVWDRYAKLQNWAWRSHHIHFILFRGRRYLFGNVISCEVGLWWIARRECNSCKAGMLFLCVNPFFCVEENTYCRFQVSSFKVEVETRGRSSEVIISISSLQRWCRVEL